MTNFGSNGRLGNQLFQYAFMRTQAEGSKLKLYLPKWIGDSVFHLEDKHIRSGPPREKLKEFCEPCDSFGYNSIELPSAVDVTGFFQSERMFDRVLIRRAYSFRESILARARECLGVDFNPSEDLAMGIRLGDFYTTPTHYCPRQLYYRAALRRFCATRIFLFSDDTQVAVKHIRDAGFDGQILPMSIPPILTLAAMSRFRNFIIGPSTFHWWGAWLSASEDKRVVAPLEGATRPGAPARAIDFWPPDWQTLRALRKFDTYKIRVRVYPAIRRLSLLLRSNDKVDH